ncbi:anti-phage dCTP deaminase [Polaromonas sp. AET17H-212]|uniref:anti-phage dCTP deaminase n=1 Tax=Polaromonas sp. AET17H-212 TaxID=1977061 RepID=UPI000BBB7E44|nr:anti-phage dCTP deaminase [Polaromonas sp. AET17H-212]
MSALLKQASMPKDKVSRSNEKLTNKFNARRSDELVIALAGPIGCGLSGVAEALEERLRERGYVDVVRIKLSKFIEEALSTELVSKPQLDPTKSARYNRYRLLQEAGKALRQGTSNPAILAEFAAKAIALDRGKRGTEVPGRVAYLIEQVKRPEEVTLLRALYRNLFYLAGVTRIYDRRVSTLEGEHVRADEVNSLMEIDRLEDREDGQQLDKTLHLADYFIRNDAMTANDKQEKLVRFLNLLHGDKSVTPSDAENGMYAAYSASLRSACLSRQVGAAISTSSGEIVATGCNDVPKPGGGLYTDSAKVTDMRCIHQEGRECFNDLHKKNLQEAIGSAIDVVLAAAADATPEGEDANGEQDNPIVLTQKRRNKLLAAIYENTRIKDLIEFSRSVHAEMDAIVSLARIGGTSLQGATLYTTTFPCHNCARHIVAAGIMKVFYVEPYEKSLAKDLHKDAIAFEVEESTEITPQRVEFLHFEGVAPRLFHNMFRATDRKNSEGKFVPIKIQLASKGVPEYLDSYRDFELKAVEHLEQEITILREKQAKKSTPGDPV